MISRSLIQPHTRYTLLLITILITAGILAACNNSTQEPNTNIPENTKQETPEQNREILLFIDKLEENLPQLFVKKRDDSPTITDTEQPTETTEPLPAEQVNTPEENILSPQALKIRNLADKLKITHKILATELYPEFQNFYFDDKAILTQNAEIILETLENADFHALDPNNYNIDTIKKTAEKLHNTITGIDAGEGIWINEREKNALYNDIETASFDLNRQNALEEYFNKITESESTSPIPQKSR